MMKSSLQCAVIHLSKIEALGDREEVFELSLKSSCTLQNSICTSTRCVRNPIDICEKVSRRSIRNLKQDSTQVSRLDFKSDTCIFAGELISSFNKKS